MKRYRCYSCDKLYFKKYIICEDCRARFGVSQSRSSGGSSAAGTGQRAHSSDGCNLSGKDLTLKKVTSYEGEGEYLIKFRDAGYGTTDHPIRINEHIKQGYLVWKIPE